MYDLNIEQDINNSYYNLIFLFIFILILVFLLYISFVNSTKQPRSVSVSKADYDLFENKSRQPNLLEAGEVNTNKPLDYNTLHEYAILENCPKGKCVVDMNTGAKRCPENENISLTFIPTSEVCTNKFTCDYKNLPFGLRPDNSANNSSCGVSEPCRCVEFSQCATQITSTFDVINGSPYGTNSDELNYYFTLNSQNDPFFNKDSLVIKTEDVGSRFCRINPAFTDRIINGCEFSGSISDPIDCAAANVFQVLEDNTAVTLIPSNYNVRARLIGSDGQFSYVGYNSGEQNIFIYDSSNKDYNIYTKGYFEFTIYTTTYQIYYRDTFVFNFIEVAKLDGSRVIEGNQENYTFVQLKNILGRVKGADNDWQVGFPVFINYKNEDGEPSNPTKAVKMTPISVVYQPCQQDKITANYKNMLQCLQPLQQPCNFGTLTYNVDQILDNEGGNVTSVYDQENSRNFCRAFNKTRLDSSKVQQFYLNDPGSFTTSCMIGAGCGGTFDDNLCTENDCSEAINQRKNNFFGNYDASAVQNYWILSNFGPLNYPGLDIKPANGNTPPVISITGKTSMLELEPGDYWQRNDPNIIKILTKEANIGDSSIVVNNVNGLRNGDILNYLGNITNNVYINTIDTENNNITLNTTIGVSIPKGEIIRVIDVLNSNEFGLIGKNYQSDINYLLAIDGKSAAAIENIPTENLYGTLNGEFKAVYYNNNKWLAVGEDKLQRNVNNIWTLEAGQYWDPVGESSQGPFGRGGVANDVYYGGTSWVVVGKNAESNDNTLYYSTDDGDTWVVGKRTGEATSGVMTGEFKAVHYGGTSWVAVGEDQSGASNNIWVSTDGETWTAKEAFGKGGVANDVYYGGTSWVAVGKNIVNTDNSLYYSTDNGDTWVVGKRTGEATSGVMTGEFKAVHYDNNKWVAVGEDQSGKSNNIWVSTDGETWTSKEAFGKGGVANDVYYGGTSWVAVGKNADTDKEGPNANQTLFFSSDNAETWELGDTKIDGLTKILTDGIIIYKQFGFNGINYNTTFSPTNMNRVYSNSFVYNEFINSGTLPPFTYSGIPGTSTSTLAQYSKQAFNDANVDFKNLKSMYYPVWNNSNFKQECILCNPGFFAFSTISDINQLSSAQIQFSGQQFFNYARWKEDKNYVYTSFTKIIAANSNTNFLVMENVNNNIAVGDYILDAPGFLERNLVSDTPSSTGSINIKQASITNVIPGIQSYTPTSFFEPFVVVDKAGDKNELMAQSGATADYNGTQYFINFENKAVNYFMGKKYSDESNNLYEINPLVKVIDIIENNVIFKDANVNLNYNGKSNFFIQTHKKE